MGVAITIVSGSKAAEVGSLLVLALPCELPKGPIRAVLSLACGGCGGVEIRCSSGGSCFALPEVARVGGNIRLLLSRRLSLLGVNVSRKAVLRVLMVEGLLGLLGELLLLLLLMLLLVLLMMSGGKGLLLLLGILLGRR